MLRLTDTHRDFETLARAFLVEHAEIRHQWREVRDAWGGRTDLVCGNGPNEVFASLTNYQITVGTPQRHTDFEEFGRGLSDQEVAQEAFEYFVTLLREAHLPESPKLDGA